MALYTQLARADIDKIADQYGIKKIVNVSPIKGGNANTSYCIRTKSSQYVLTILEEKDIKQAKELARLLKWLKKYDFKTSIICSTRAGSKISQIGSKPIILKKWVPGGVIQKLSTKKIKRVGKSLAELHQIPVPKYIPKTHAFGMETFAEVIGKKIDPEYESWLKVRLKKISRKISERLPRGLIHGDLFYDNILFENGKLKAIIDFEESCNYYYVFDIAMGIIGVCREMDRLNLEKVKAFLKGYEQVRSLGRKEKEALQFFIEYSATATSRWRYWKYNIDSLNLRLKDKHWEMVELAKEVNKIKRKKFLKKVFE